ncbi:hypothetical protein G4O51_11475 [Candidatus Bathyarchaeota archaeon A05DMB-2]|nr:hypothetical protein [Candidatus Bathyarchaeota archaeon A05DMB-2]
MRYTDIDWDMILMEWDETDIESLVSVAQCVLIRKRCGSAFNDCAVYLERFGVQENIGESGN